MPLFGGLCSNPANNWIQDYRDFCEINFGGTKPVSINEGCSFNGLKQPRSTVHFACARYFRGLDNARCLEVRILPDLGTVSSKQLSGN